MHDERELPCEEDIFRRHSSSCRSLENLFWSMVSLGKELFE